MTRELVGGSVVALALFAAGYSAGSLSREATTPEVDELRAEIEQLQAANARLEWELKVATEELPEWIEYQ